MAETKVHRLGPKDWDPHTDRCLCPKNDLPLLTPEERSDLRTFERMKADDPVMARISAMVRRLARLTTLDFEFPKYIGWVNPIAENVTALRLEGPIFIESAMTVPGGLERFEVFDHTSSCGPVEGMVFIRPYVRIVGMPAEPAVEALRSAKININVDGFIVVRDGPLDEHLVGPDGHGFRRRPFSFTMPASCPLFRASYVSENPPVSGYLDFKTQSFEEFGLMLPNGTKILMEIIGAGPIPPVELKTGLVAAMYTTRP